MRFIFLVGFWLSANLAIADDTLTGVKIQNCKDNYPQWFLMQPEGSGVGVANKGVLSFAQALTDMATQKN